MVTVIGCIFFFNSGSSERSVSAEQGKSEETLPAIPEQILTERKKRNPPLPEIIIDQEILDELESLENESVVQPTDKCGTVRRRGLLRRLFCR